MVHVKIMLPSKKLDELLTALASGVSDKLLYFYESCFNVFIGIFPVLSRRYIFAEASVSAGVSAKGLDFILF